MKKILRVVIVLPIMFLLSGCLVSSVQAERQTERKNIIFTGDFESGTYAGWNTREGCCKHSHTIVTKPVRAGRYASRSLLKSSDPLIKYGDAGRAEIQLNSFPKNAERWVGVSIYFPVTGDKEATSVFQFHLKPDKGQKWTSPPFQMYTKNEQIVMKRYGRATVGESQEWILGSVSRGQWTDFVFHIKSSSTPKGVFEVWVNGVQKVQYRGITMLPQYRGHFIKAGPYKGKGHQVTTDTIIYYDELRIGNQNAKYQDVAPSGSRAVN